MEKKKILVTGGLGHIGSKLVREYSNRKEVDLIRMYDNLHTQRYCSLFNLPYSVNYEFIEGDINDKNKLEEIVKDIDVVIHLAAITDAPSTVNNKEETFRVNLEGTINILNASINTDVKRFLFPSTTSVYGGAIGLVDENYKNYKPESPYAESKLITEKIVQEASNKSLNTTILRMGTIFGASIGMRFHTAVNKFCYLASMNKPLTIWDSALNSKRPYLGLADCINAFEFLEKNGKPGEIYNVLTDNFSINKIIDSIKKFRDVKIEITKNPLLNQSPYEVSNDKIKKLGFEFKDNLKESIEETIKLFESIKNPV
ncbi:MAG: NAD(P)-dependent oxidoreductase [Nanoarchaeota archaeon]